MKLELPSSFRPSPKMEVKLEKGNSLRGIISHKSTAEMVIQTRIGDLILPFFDERLEKGQTVRVFKNHQGRMFIDTAPGEGKPLDPALLKESLSKFPGSVTMDLVDLLSTKEGDAPKSLKSSDVYSRLMGQGSSGGVLFGLVVEKLSQDSTVRAPGSAPLPPQAGDLHRYIVESQGTRFEVASPRPLQTGDFFSFVAEKTAGQVKINQVPENRAMPVLLGDILKEAGLKYDPAFRIAYDKLESFKDESFFPKAVVDFGMLLKSSGVLQVDNIPPEAPAPLEIGLEKNVRAQTSQVLSTAKVPPPVVKGLINFLFNFSTSANKAAGSQSQNSSVSSSVSSSVHSPVNPSAPPVAKAGQNPLPAGPNLNMPAGAQPQSTAMDKQPLVPARETSGTQAQTSGVSEHKIENQMKGDVTKLTFKEGELLPQQIKSDTPILTQSIRNFIPVTASLLESQFQSRNVLIDLIYQFIKEANRNHSTSTIASESAQPSTNREGAAPSAMAPGSQEAVSPQDLNPKNQVQDPNLGQGRGAESSQNGSSPSGPVSESIPLHDKGEAIRQSHSSERVSENLPPGLTGTSPLSPADAKRMELELPKAFQNILPEKLVDTSVNNLLSLFLTHPKDEHLPKTQAALWGLMVKFPSAMNFLLDMYRPIETSPEAQGSKQTGAMLTDIHEKMLLFKENVSLPMMDNSRPFSLADFYSELSRKDSGDSLNVDLKLQKFVSEAIQSDLASSDSKFSDAPLSGYSWVDNRWRRVRFQFGKNSGKHDKKSEDLTLDIELDTMHLKKVKVSATVQTEGAKIHIKHESGNIDGLLPAEVKHLEKSLRHMDFKVIQINTSKLRPTDAKEKSPPLYGKKNPPHKLNDGVDLEA